LIIQAYNSGDLIEKQIEIEQELKANYFKFKQQLIQIFESRCEEKVT
jgi:hypothetical protein